MLQKYFKLFLITSFCIGFFFSAQPVAAHEGHTHDLPDGFVKTQITDSLAQPVGLAQTPDGRIFVIEKAGVVKVIKNGTLLPAPALNISSRVNSDYERGLLGIAFDSNTTVYLYYVNNSPLEIRIAKFSLSGDTINAGSEQILLKSTQTLSRMHHAGTLRIGPDGKLWASVGNNDLADNSQDLSNIHGKILRINTDGSVPTDNPFYDRAGAHKAIWAYGFRNPFRFNFMGSLPIVGDVGLEKFEEINIVEKGANYGWPGAEGACTGCGYKNPFYYYAHPAGGSASVTGGFVYKTTTQPGSFPASYNNSYFYADYAQGFIKRLTIDGGSVLTDEDFAPTAGAAVDLLQGADGALYYVSFYPAGVFKIQFSTENQAPTAKITATPDAGLAPLTVQFSSDGSIDPEGKPLTYSWNFGNGATSTQANPTYTYTQNGTYTAALSVSDGSLQSSTISFPIRVGVTPPTATITSPIHNAKYNAGNTITYSATATDQKDGNLPESAYSWKIVFHHGTHTHPFLDVTGKKSGTFTIPTTGEPSADTWYVLHLTVTNSQGVKTTVSHTITPNKVKLSFTASSSAALTITMDGSPVTLPATIDAVTGFQYTVDVPTPQTVNGDRYDFVSWSDKGAKTHTITTPATNATYAVTFKKAGTGKGDIYFRVREFDKDGKFTGKFINGATAKLTDPTGNTVYTATTSAKDSKGEDGWVKFKGVQEGLYGLMVYKADMEGYWLQTDCTTGGTTQNATIRNANTTGILAGFQSNVESFENAITWCKDIGLKPATASIYFKVWLMGVDSQTATGYGRVTDLNGVTVKLTDTTGNTVYQTVTTVTASWGTNGWAFIKDVKPGTYGIMAYKTGYKGFWKQTDCNGTEAINTSIKNANTAGLDAAWNNNVVAPGGTITWCLDLGLLSESKAKVGMRIKEFDTNGNPTGTFINGATVKLTDPTGNIVYQTTTSAKDTAKNQEGWAYFTNVPSGKYSIVAYKTGHAGYWKQTDCGAGGTINGATLQNKNTEGLLAGYQTDVFAIGGQTTYCKDIGLKNTNTVAKGNIRYRVRAYDAKGAFTGEYLNGAKAKLTSLDGTTVIAATTSAVQKGSENGWVYFDNIPVGSYGVITYAPQRTGFWKQTDCNGTGVKTNATIQNANTEGLLAAFQSPVSVTQGQNTFCKDVGLREGDSTPQQGSLKFRIREFDAQNKPTGAFINGATVKLLDQYMTIQHQVATSSAVGSEDGWVRFDIQPGTYSVVVFKDGLEGVWRQTDCGAGGTTDNATVKNSFTDDKLAAKQENVAITSGDITFCKDVALKNPTVSPSQGHVNFRVRQFANGTFSGNFVNGATVKLVDGSGNVVATTTSAAENGQDGWVHLSGPEGNFQFVVYKTGMSGIWRQTNCTSDGTTNDVTIQNSTTENMVAAKQNVLLVKDTSVFCKDVGLQ